MSEAAARTLPGPAGDGHDTRIGPAVDQHGSCLCDRGQHPEPDELLARAQLFYRQAAGSADEHDGGYPCRYSDLAKEVGQGRLAQVGTDVADTRAPDAIPDVVGRRCHEMSWETGGSARSASMMAWSRTASLAAYVPP